jgi:hypothetical protein
MTTTEVNVEELTTLFNDTKVELHQLLSSFTAEQFNRSPFENSWTVGQVAKHLAMSSAGFLEILSGPVRETERAPDEWVSIFKRDFLNFNIKMTSPEFVRPENKSYEKEGLIKCLDGTLASIQEAIYSLDLTKTCLAFELPVSGFITRLEAIYFVIYHSKRHIHQLKNIARKVK